MKPRLAIVFLLSSACGPGDSAGEDEIGADSTGSESGSSTGDEVGSEAESADESATTEESESGSEPPDPSGPPIPADPDAPPIVYAIDSEIWRIAADGSDAAPIGLSIFPNGGSAKLYYGSNHASVSRDGTRIAYLDQGDVMVADIDGDLVESKRAIDMPKGTWTEVGITTWSPDSSTVLAFVREFEPIDTEGPPPPLPDDFQAGTFVIDGESVTATHVEHFWGWLEWAGDSDILVDGSASGEPTQLLRYSPAGGEPTLVREIDDAYGFVQLHTAGDRMVWTATGPDADQSQIMLASVLGGEAVPLSPKGAWAEIQLPVLAPTADRAFVSITSELKGAISEGTDELHEIPLSGYTPVLRWEGDQHLLAVTQAGLIRMDINGNTTVLDAAATALLRQ